MAVQDVLFTLISPKELKDDIVDVFMSMPNLSGFNLKKINGYSTEHSSYNITEQVEGYRELFQFEVLTNITEKEALLLALKPLCQPAKLRYWFMPVLDSGHF